MIYPEKPDRIPFTPLTPGKKFRWVLSSLLATLILVFNGGGGNPVQANHAGRCEAAPTYMLVPHWIQTELCDYKDKHDVQNFTVQSVPMVAGDGMVTFDGIWFGDEFIAMLMFDVDEHGKRGQLLFYGSEISGKRYYAPERGVDRLEL